MGLQASIDIYFEKLSFKNIIEKLSNNWDINDQDKISYMDNDDFDWLSVSLKEKENILTLLEERFYRNNSVGITLVNKHNSGGMFIFYPDENLLSIIININRKKNDNTQLTDYSYYMDYLIPILDTFYKIIYTDIY